MSEMDKRVETARKLGKDPYLVLHGGGNASLKVIENDHAGRIIKVLRVKGSGSDLAKIDEKGFTGLRMEDLLHARTIESMNDIEMMDYLKKSMVDPSQPSPSVESFLHAFIPYTYVDHSHSDHILAITNSGITREKMKDILGNVLLVEYVMPGFKLAKRVLEIADKITPDVDGIVLLNHGLFTFGESAEESYSKHVKIVERARKYLEDAIEDDLFTEKYGNDYDFAEKLPLLRGLLSKYQKKILLIDRSNEGKRISKSIEAEKFRNSGPATPDMLIRTKYDYLYLTGESNIEAEVKRYEARYIEEYEKYVGNYPMHDPYPTIIVVQGFGIITAARNIKECKIILDQCHHTFIVNSMADKISRQKFISRRDAFVMEYWPLEEAKLKKYVPKPLEGRICMVTGGASGIGLETVKKLAENGAVVLSIDVDDKLESLCEEISNETGSTVSPFKTDLTNPNEIREMVNKAKLRFGGVDVVFHNAGILKSEYIEEIKLETLLKHIEINSIAPFVLTQETFKIMKDQGLGGNYIFNITKNLTNPGPGMISYGSSKAFTAQLCHYVAKEGGKYGIRSNIINPDKIFKNSKIWENGVLEARAKAKGISADEYKKSNLLRREVLPEHVANVVMVLINEEIFGATTDAMIPVDGGVL